MVFYLLIAITICSNIYCHGSVVLLAYSGKFVNRLKFSENHLEQIIKYNTDFTRMPTNSDSAMPRILTIRIMLPSAGYQYFVMIGKYWIEMSSEMFTYEINEIHSIPAKMEEMEFLQLAVNLWFRLINVEYKWYVSQLSQNSADYWQIVPRQRQFTLKKIGWEIFFFVQSNFLKMLNLDPKIDVDSHIFIFNDT